MTERQHSRRGFLLGGAAVGLAGAAAGYKFHDPLLQRVAAFRETPRSLPSSARQEFARQAAGIREKQSLQTLETVRALKAKYESPILGKVRVWDMIERLGMCIDASDDSLMLTSQFMHVQQILEGMEKDGIEDKDLFLIALLHDVGKVMLLAQEVPEHVVGYVAPIGEFPHGVGLDNMIFQFGHDEIIYSRIKDHVPEHVAWTIRHHSSMLGVIDPYLDERERKYRNPYFAKFQMYDLGKKSYTHVPHVEMASYRALIEDTFPHPILF